MFRILQSFIPWILYFILVSSQHFGAEIAAISALVATIVFNSKELRKKFILVWGTLIYFAFLSIMYLSPGREWFIEHAPLLSNLVFAMIMWISIAIKKPFTIQYAREETDKAIWDSPLFIRVNYLLTFMWAIITSLTAVINLMQFWQIIASSLIATIIQTALILFAVYFTKIFPDWYQGHLFRKLSQPLENIAANPFLNGNYAPVQDEIAAENLKVIGKIPQDLRGIYMRNGSNPAFHPISYTYPFDGDGMLHAIYLENGKASYRNRFIETKGLLAERKAGHALYGGIMRPIPGDPKLIGKEGDPGPIKNGAFIHIIRHANQCLAMWEAGPAYQVNDQLQTIGEWSPINAKPPFNINAHTRYDAMTKELHAFSYDLQPPYLNYYVIDANGKLIKNIPIAKSYGSMMHDFVLTKNYAIFFDCPAIFNMKAMASGNDILSWQPNLGVKIGILNRINDNIFWIATEPFFIFHFANAYEKNDNIIVDYVKYDSLSFGREKSSNSPKLFRTIINLKSKTAVHNQIDDRLVEFPRINDAVNSKFNRYIYTSAETTSNKVFNALIKYDVEQQQSSVHDFGRDAQIGEAVFAPRLSATNEDDGYIMLFVYNKQENNSDFVILDAQDFTAAPLARVKLPRRIPEGLHGSWLPC